MNAKLGPPVATDSTGKPVTSIKLISYLRCESVERNCFFFVLRDINPRTENTTKPAKILSEFNKKEPNS